MKKVSTDAIIQAPGSEYEILKDAIKQEIHSALPGFVISYDKSSQTCSVQLAIRERRANQNIDLPILTDVPVFMPCGKGGGMTYPIKSGDECLVVFSDACIDSWFNSGTISNVISVRRHDLSDGFAFVGFRSRKNALTDLPDSTVIENTVDELPEATEAFRGQILLLKGDTDDTAYICKKTDGTYQWTELG